ncbi:MAG: family hydrolase [Dehalococcoidales bacterium]|nr:family hydrolase [Dehalococcoidales bacterium]
MDPFPAIMQLQMVRFHERCQQHGLAIDGERIIQEWTRSNSRVNYPYIGHFYQEEPIIHDALRHLSVREDIAVILGLELLREYRIGLRNIIESDKRTREVKNTLEQLRARGKKLGVFSNDRIVALGFILEAMKVKPFFEYIETSESIGIEKPDPRVFKHITSFFRVQPELIVYVGDDPVRDIEAAKEAGLGAIQHRVNEGAYDQPWRNYRVKPRHEPDAVIEHFGELLDVIE